MFEGNKALQLLKEREKEKEEIEFQKKKIAKELMVGEISSKFAVHYDSIESQLKSDTVGLVTLEEMKERQKAYLAERERKVAIGRNSDLKIREGLIPLKKKAKRTGPVSFDEIDDPELSDEEVKPSDKEEEQSNDKEESVKSKKDQKRYGINPNVDKMVVPDIYREAEEKELREQLGAEWVAKQAAIKEEEMNITYSYWDGSGHRRVLKVKKGHTIHLFLHKCIEQLRKDFSELKCVSADQMMFVKEDVIIPHHYTFYDLIVTKARGKSGPLFVFDVYDDVRLMSDASVDKNESHAGKVCLRSYYERHKHIFPASRWEPYDPSKIYENYTISDKVSSKSKAR